MTNLNRLKLELGEKEYFSDENYSNFLMENGLTPTEEYQKSENLKNLLFTLIDVLEAVSNDVDLMRTVETEFATTGQAYSYLEKRIASIKDRIAAIPEPEAEYSAFSLMFSRN